MNKRTFLPCAAVIALAACEPSAPEVMDVRAKPSCHQTTMEAPALKCLRPGSVAVWGDSMAWGWEPAIRRKHGDAVPLTRDGCGPLLGVPGDYPANAKCREFSAMAAEAVQHFDTVYLVGRWAACPDTFGETLAAVAPKVRRVVVIGPSPEMADTGVTRAEFDAVAAPLLARLRKDASLYRNVQVVDVTDQLCGEICAPELDGLPLYADAYHLRREMTARMDIP